MLVKHLLDWSAASMKIALCRNHSAGTPIVAMAATDSLYKLRQIATLLR